MKKISILFSLCLLLSSTIVTSTKSFATTWSNEEQTTNDSVTSTNTTTTSSTNDDQETSVTTDSSASDSSSDQTTSETDNTSTTSNNLATNQTATNSKSTRDATETIQIPDAVLKENILTTLGLAAGSDLTQADMDKLTSLYLPNSLTTISSLEGLEYATNLESINMSTNNVTDFSPLENLTHLVYVRLQGDNVTSDNYPDLSKNKELTLINLSGSGVDDRVLDKLTALTSLESITFESNMKITTIAPLKVLPNLRELRVQFCAITDFTVINDFPTLSNLAAYGQNTGRNDALTKVNSAIFNYQAETQTMFIPFSMMPNRMVNFDGYVPPFTTSNSASQTYLDFNGVQVASTRLEITDEGITVTGVTKEEFDGIETFEYNAFLNNPAGMYAQPDGFTFYAISSGTYLHGFTVVHGPEAAAPITVKYVDEEGTLLTDEEVLNGNLDDPYETSPQEFDGWVIKTLPENAAGLFTDTPQEVIYVYEKAEAAPITVKYLDEKGQEIAKSETLTGKLGEKFQTTPKELKNWVLTATPENAAGLFSQNAQTVIYVYQNETEPTKETTSGSTTDSSSKEKPDTQHSTATDQTKKATRSQDKKNQALPQTNERQNPIWIACGSLIILIFAFLYHKKYLSTK